MHRRFALRCSLPPPGREVGALDLLPLPVGPSRLPTAVPSTGPPAQNLRPAPVTDLPRAAPHPDLCAGHPGTPSGSGSVPCLPVQPLPEVPPPGMSDQSRATALLSALLPLTEASPVRAALVTLPADTGPERPPCPPASSPSAHIRPPTPARVSELTHTLCFSRAAGEPFLPRS